MRAMIGSLIRFNDPARRYEIECFRYDWQGDEDATRTDLWRYP